jgi:PAS domain S-box-containing protein
VRPADEVLHQFFNKSEDLLAIVGLDGRFKPLNPAWQPALGWSWGELQARPFLDLVYPEDRPATRVEMDRLGSGAETVTFEDRCQCKEGGIRWLRWTCSLLPGRAEIFSVARDLTPLKRMEEEVLRALDSERKRMGRDLHDGHCQSLAAIAALCAALARKLAPSASSESALAGEIGSLLGRSIQQVRDLARGLHPTAVSSFGLVKAIADFCANTGAMFGITCNFHCEARPRGLNAQRESQLLRITQEAVNNAIAHGKAHTIEVVLSSQNNLGTLAIHDDGMGIGAPAERNPGIGLHTMAYRARMVGGSLDISRRSPHGTSVTCVFRLPSADH